VALGSLGFLLRWVVTVAALVDAIQVFLLSGSGNLAKGQRPHWITV